MLLVGFARTFFLRSLFNVPPIPAYLYVHGVALTAWFVLVFAQACLIAARRTAVHRRLGVITMLVALLVVPISAFVVIRSVPRATAAGANSMNIQGVVITDLISLVVFSVLVATALHLRHRPDIHRRFMICSCLVIFGPVNARLARLGLPLWFGLVHVPLSFLVPAAYDLLTIRRLHRATLWIGMLVVVKS